MTNLLEQIAKLEKQKQDLIQKRKNEIMDIFIQTSAIATDNHLIAGALLFISDPNNKNDPIISNFKELAKTKKIKFPARKTQNKK